LAFIPPRWRLLRNLVIAFPRELEAREDVGWRRSLSYICQNRFVAEFPELFVSEDFAETNFLANDY
jgi:hypothetical protein